MQRAGEGSKRPRFESGHPDQIYGNGPGNLPGPFPPCGSTS